MGHLQHQSKCNRSGMDSDRDGGDSFEKGILNEKEILSVSPIGRFGKVEEVANLACFLACEESDYIAGQIIFADGGWNTGIMPNALDYIRENDKED